MRPDLLGSISSASAHRSCGEKGQGCILCWRLNLVIGKSFSGGIGWVGSMKESWKVAEALHHEKAMRGYWWMCTLVWNGSFGTERVIYRSWRSAPCNRRESRRGYCWISAQLQQGPQYSGDVVQWDDIRDSSRREWRWPGLLMKLPALLNIELKKQSPMEYKRVSGLSHHAPNFFLPFLWFILIIPGYSTFK